MIKQIKFISIPVRDQNRALDFYTDKLGFTIITDSPSTASNAGSSCASPKPRRGWCSLLPTDMKIASVPS